MKIQEIPMIMRPREKAKLQGLESLSDRELLAIFIRGGTRGQSALDIADKILHITNGLPGLRLVSRSDLIKLRGIRDIKATEILALKEISKRINKPMQSELNFLDSPQQIIRWINEGIGYMDQEVFLVIGLDIHLNVIDCVELFKGTVDYAHVHPRDVFREAVRLNASQLILVHNHPSGSKSFSPSDYEITRMLVKTGEMMGIGVLEHVLVTRGYHVFMSEERNEIFQIELT